MLSELLRPGTERDETHCERVSCLLDGQLDRFVAALFSGGDSRIAADPCTGLNKYLCPQRPAPELTCLSSCTASPVSADGFAQAAAAFLEIVGAPSSDLRRERLTALTEHVKDRLLDYFHVRPLADVILCPSGTDAMLTTALLMARSRPGRTMTAVIPSASETGTGVPMAAICRAFDGLETGRLLSDCAGTTVEIPLRSEDGSPRTEDEVNAAFVDAAAGASGDVIVYLTHGTKTGLIAPVSPPTGVDVIVDACQARIAPDTVAAYVALGWPVVVTGSKFFGGPAFSGAVLFPRDRLPKGPPSLAACDEANIGTALRWTAAIAAIDAFEQRSVNMAAVLQTIAAEIERELGRGSTLVPVGGLRPGGSVWADQPSIFTFGVRDPNNHRRLLTTSELRPHYERLAQRGVLLGQPVALGSFGGLRLAIGSHDLSVEACKRGLGQVFATLREQLREAISA